MVRRWLQEFGCRFLKLFPDWGWSFPCEFVGSLAVGWDFVFVQWRRCAYGFCGVGWEFVIVFRCWFA